MPPIPMNTPTDKDFLTEHTGDPIADAQANARKDRETLVPLREARAKQVRLSQEEQKLTKEHYGRMDAKKLRDRLRAVVKRFEKAGWGPVDARCFVANNFPEGKTGRKYAIPAPRQGYADVLEDAVTGKPAKEAFRPGKNQKTVKKALSMLRKENRRKSDARKFPEQSNFYVALPPGPNLPARITAARDEAWERGYFEGLRVVRTLIDSELTKNGQKP